MFRQYIFILPLLLLLVWNYSHDRSNIVFNLYWKHHIEDNFIVYVTDIQETNIEFNITSDMGFYTVTASNTITHFESDYCIKE